MKKFWLEKLYRFSVIITFSSLLMSCGDMFEDTDRLEDSDLLYVPYSLDDTLVVNYRAEALDTLLRYIVASTSREVLDYAPAPLMPGFNSKYEEYKCQFKLDGIVDSMVDGFCVTMSGYERTFSFSIKLNALSYYWGISVPSSYEDYVSNTGDFHWLDTVCNVNIYGKDYEMVYKLKEYKDYGETGYIHQGKGVLQAISTAHTLSSPDTFYFDWRPKIE